MSEKAQGFEEYTPSRLEWLIVMLNSYVHYINTIPDDPFDYLYTLGSDGNTIVMHMRYYTDTPQHPNPPNYQSPESGITIF